MNKQKKTPERRAYTRQFYRGNGGNLALGILGMVLMVAANLAISWLMQQLIDVATGAETGFSLGTLALLGLAFTLVFLLSGVCSYVARPRFMAKAMRQYKNFVFERISRKSIAAFAGENSSLYISALSNDANNIENDYLNNIFDLISYVLFFVGALAMMLYYSPVLTLVSIALALLPVAAALLAGNRMAEAEKRVSVRNESFMSTLKDSLTGFSVVKSFRAEKEMCRLFAESIDSVESAKSKKRGLSVVIQTLAGIASLIAQFGVFIIGAWMALNGRGVTGGVVIVFVQLMNFVISPIQSVPQILAARKAANALIDKLAAALAENVRSEGGEEIDGLHEAIEVRDLGFAYAGGEPVLKGVDLRFEAGKSYAVVGASGSGKSTLLSLLMGGGSGYTGEIRYDGVELRDIKSDSLYDLVSIVQQSVFVFNSSLLDNVTMFRDFDPERIDKAIAMSGLAPLMEARGGDYACGENGSGLSGGERQRVSIARCLLRGTPVMLVDEATAALDAETAAAVTNSILDISGLTRIVVTHRLEEAILRRYDKIYVLRGGTVEEAGSFGELMEKKGYFYSLFTVSQ
ncbi:MAG: ABC transporter ATP-binding protein [Oscillospiraceae bacterium]